MLCVEFQYVVNDVQILVCFVFECEFNYLGILCICFQGIFDFLFYFSGKFGVEWICCLVNLCYIIGWMKICDEWNI